MGEALEKPILETIAISLYNVFSHIDSELLPQGVLSLQATSPSDWKPRAVFSAYDWCLSEQGKHALLESGFDPDMLQPPPTRKMTLVGRWIRLYNSHPEKSIDILLGDSPEYIPGKKEITIEPTKEKIDNLRELVTKYGFVPTQEVVEFLSKMATAETSPAKDISPTSTTPSVLWNEERGVFLLKNVNQPPYTDTLRTIVGARWEHHDKVWMVPGEHRTLLSDFTRKHNVKVPQGFFSSPLLFDGTIEGLRGVPIAELKSIPRKRLSSFEKFGIKTAYDVLFSFPRKYLDRSEVATVRKLVETQEDTCIIGVVKNIQADARRRMARISITDGTGVITATFFNAAWQAKRFKVGDQVIMLGKPEKYRANNSWSMVNPILDPYQDSTSPVIPVYPQSGKAGVTTWDLRRATEETVSRVTTIKDPLPENIIEEHELMPRWEAIRGMHFPDNLAMAKESRKRVAFDELFNMQTVLLLSKNMDDTEKGVQHDPNGYLTSHWVKGLPFPLTGAQERAIKTIKNDLQKPHPMHRLLQGDVGAGKTAVAVYSLLSAVESGHQAALMAPTEILARQLYNEIVERTEGLKQKDGSPIKIEYFTNRLRGKKRTAALEELASGEISIAVGTHALLSEDVVFNSLGLVVVDEQHRFGVEQRANLRGKGPNGAKPDMLIMTATPIPRTSAMTIFGDLDVTILDELPPGRTPVLTQWFDQEPELSSRSTNPWKLVREQVGAGRQAFVVCPLVEESEKLQAASATETFESLQTGALSGLKLGLVHGQQKPEQRDEIMRDFRDGNLDVLVATTVIEVGVNIPNATVMVILDSIRFGLSQLHQLRGRVGRGANKSFCYLVGRGKSSESRARMEAMVSTNDGFVLSEIDLDLRGEGALFGSRQSGQSDLHAASLKNDRELLEKARDSVIKLLEKDPNLSRHPSLRNEVYSSLDEEAREWLGRN